MPEFGRVIGRFLVPIVDSNDPDTTPDLVPLTGRIHFTLNAPRVLDPTASPVPAVLASATISATLDNEGYLCTPNSSGGVAYRGLWLVATDDPDLNPTDMQYTVSYELSLASVTLVSIPDHAMALPAGSTIDLAFVIPPAFAPPIGLAAAEAAAAAAATSAETAVEALAQMLLSADIREVVKVTQAEYDQIPTPRPDDILYVIIP